ncbi:nocturnin-like isoform X1 [Gouania willdenowi]|uniref:nocturnin-like isoform X1 n=1 Tax=Gouania willdenowi TaxID=441366 RepID=UPI0010543539|nr:nocturnin-like isoform X1 [Gouania willdenowi]
MESLAVCPMEGGALRLYSALTFGSSAPLTLPSSTHTDLDQVFSNVDPKQDSTKQECLCDPMELLQCCEDALRDGAPRFQRTFVHLNQGGGAIRVMQWNILAQALGEGLDSFVRCPLEALSWSHRKLLILEEVLAYRPHILCLQEVDHYYDTLQPALAALGYSGHFCPKPWSLCLDVEGNNGPDGCALFYDRSRFEFIDSVNIGLTALKIPTNQVAVATTLRCKRTGRRVCVAATHLKARSGWEWLRSAQGLDLLVHLENLVQNQDASLIVCGDFNAVPTEEVYRDFLASPLGLESACKELSQDGSSEPDYTTWKIRSTGECCATLDYIWYSRDALRVDAVLDVPSEEEIGPDRLPSFSYPSDHLSLVCDFSFREEE